MKRIDIDIAAVYALYQEIQSIRETAALLTQQGTPIASSTLQRKFAAAGLDTSASPKNGKRGKRKDGTPALSNAEKQQRYKQRKWEEKTKKEED